MKAAVAVAALVADASTVAALVSRGALRARHDKKSFGDARCPCIGFDELDGETVVAFSNTTSAKYPADLGARCEAWDDKRHPDCKEGGDPGEGEGFCEEKWCYVDSCHCDLPVLPKLATYVPEASYRGKPVFFSYATCGGKDLWTEKVPEVGTAGCRCIGFDNIPGTIDLDLEGPEGNISNASYPAEIGGTCRAWDDKRHPMCAGDSPPKWCKQRWCYVDPCSCDLDTKPKVTMYLPDATFAGKSLYYSYETCGSKDYFTEHYNLKACVNQKDEDDCLDLKVPRGGNKCAWTGKVCLGWEIVNHPMCKAMVKEVHHSGAAPVGRCAVVVLAAALLSLAF
eukprot:CAMPEP_0176272188 /NCGR_PEP_ID=MMETSP0121_2-20121125/45586_1 /TAXON_ID=160619 /ORGANISM="Kryptoperidinium foliaceum, Strain CCMP 1326" /LENGTH=338 /DNA_ID=CAMNT_0017612355 /DNA_START=45 /DNA_END=1061 /DNA_ORIENTATION=-